MEWNNGGYHCNVHVLVVQEFLKSVKKMMYSRMPGEQPRILHQEEALQIQKMNVGWSLETNATLAHHDNGQK